MATNTASSELSSPFTQEMKWQMPQVFHSILTVAEANGTAQGGYAIVPAVPGKMFMPIDVAFRATGGNATGTSLVLLQVADTDGNVVLSHVKADCTSGTWAGRYGGTVVTTKLGFPTAAGKGLKFQPTGADIETATGVETIVVGFYV